MQTQILSRIVLSNWNIIEKCFRVDFLSSLFANNYRLNLEGLLFRLLAVLTGTLETRTCHQQIT